MSTYQDINSGIFFNLYRSL